MVVDAFELERDSAGVGGGRRDVCLGHCLHGAAERDGVADAGEAVGALDEERRSIRGQAGEALFDTAMLVPMKQIEVEHLLPGGHQPHVQRLPADDPHGPEGELEGLAADHVRLVVSGQMRALATSEPWEGVGAMWRQKDPVEPLVIVGADAVALIDLAFLDKRGRVEI